MLAALRERTWQRALSFWEKRLPALTRLKSAEPLPILLHRRRIYVLPTGFGLFFGVLLLAMLLGSLNYNNNPALLLVFVLASAAHTSMLLGFMALNGVQVTRVHSRPVHAGDSAQLRVRFDREGRRLDEGIIVRCEGSWARVQSVDGKHEANVTLPTEKRGLQEVGRILIETRQPLGLVRAWSWVCPDTKILVYPKAEVFGPSPPELEPRSGSQFRRGPGEMLHSLRPYRSGDPMRLIAWKRSAQLGQVQVREHEHPIGGECKLSWRDVQDLPYESGIERLTRWVLEVHARQLRSTLALPSGTLGPGRGDEHLHACLRALALMPGHA